MGMGLFSFLLARNRHSDLNSYLHFCLDFIFDAWNSSVCMYSGCSRQRALIRDDNLDSDKSYSCDLAAVHIESDCINLRGYAGAGIGYKSDGAVRRIVNGNYYMSYMC